MARMVCCGVVYIVLCARSFYRYLLIAKKLCLYCSWQCFWSWLMGQEEATIWWVLGSLEWFLGFGVGGVDEIGLEERFGVVWRSLYWVGGAFLDFLGSVLGF